MPKLQLAPSPPSMPFIVVGSDLTSASDGALAHALYLAELLTAQVLLVHVLHANGAKPSGRKPLARRELLALQKATEFKRRVTERQLLRQIRRVRAKRRVVVVEVHTGQAALELLNVTKKRGARSLILGIADQSAGLGRVAQRVLRAAVVPVTIVPPPAASTQKRPAPAKLRLVPPLRKRDS